MNGFRRSDRFSRSTLVRLAVGLLVLTLLYNVAEGAIAVLSGMRAHSLVLVAFGGDSYVEVLAAGAVLWRLTFRDEEAGERAEGRALRLIGATFLVLAAAVLFQGFLALVNRAGASESVVGLALLMTSLIVMPALAIAKLRIAAETNMPVFAAEAKETVACSYLSVTALLGLIATAAFGWWWLDATAALLMVPWLVKEGREGLKGEACYEGARVCWCRRCWFGIRACTDLRAA